MPTLDGLASPPARLPPTSVHTCCGVLLGALVFGCGGDESGRAETEPCSPLDELRVEYLAERDSGEWLLAVRPDSVGLEPEQVRLFYGPEQRLLEHPITSFERQRDGGTTHILFEIDGAHADALFPVEPDGTSFTDGDPTLTLAGETFALTLIASPIAGDAAAADALEPVQIECLREPEAAGSEGGGAYSPATSW